MKLLQGSNAPKIGGQGAVRQDLLHSLLDLVLTGLSWTAFEQLRLIFEPTQWVKASAMLRSTRF